VAAALSRRHGYNKANQVLDTLSIPELSRTKGFRGGWRWRGANAPRNAAMRDLPYHPLPRYTRPTASASDRLLASLLGVVAGLVVAPAFALAASGMLAPNESVKIDAAAAARIQASLLLPCAVAAAVVCALFGAVRGFYYGGPLGPRLFVQCLLDCAFLNWLGNVRDTRENREKMGVIGALMLIAVLILFCFGVRAYAFMPTLEQGPSGLSGRTTRDVMQEFAFSEPLGGWREQLSWWAGLFSYPCCVLLAGLQAVALFPG
jgi:hypothetical protein